MKNFIAILLAMCVFSSKAQDTVRLVHQNYTTVYSKSLHYPVLVEWWERKTTIECPNQLPRKDQFGPDSLLINDTKIQFEYDLANKVHKAAGFKGFDRGHMSPAASNECSGVKALTECFYFSNMAPQYHSLNAGDWKTLESVTRNLAIKFDSVHIWAGSYGSEDRFIGLSIPTTCWKVVYIPSKREYQAYLFANTPNKPTGLPSHKVTVQEITKLTGFTFK